MELKNGTSLKRPPEETDQAATDQSPTSIKRQRVSRRDEIVTVKSTLDYLRKVFPLDRFNYAFPPIILRHQLYSCLPLCSRPEINHEVESLQKKKEIRCFKVHANDEEVLIVKTDDFREHVRSVAQWKDPCRSHMVIEKFLDYVNNFDTFLNASDLTDAAFTDDHIRILVNIGVIVQRDPSSWFISFPGVLQFMTVLSSGRDKVLTMVKRAKYSTVLESELIHRGLPKRCLGMHYGIHDIIGKDLVEVSNTASGRLLRYR